MGSVKQGWNGRFFEDFHVGDIYRSRLGRTITETDNIQFTMITNNTNQIHFNAHYASLTEFKKPLVNSALTLSVVAGLGVSDLSENGFALGWDYIKLPNPVFPGDTLYSESEVINARESKSRPGQGVVKVRTRGINQDGLVVIEYERSIMVWKKAHAPLIALFPKAEDGRRRTEDGGQSGRYPSSVVSFLSSVLLRPQVPVNVEHLAAQRRHDYRAGTQRGGP